MAAPRNSRHWRAVRACADRTKAPLTSVLFPSGSRDRNPPASLFFPRVPLVAQKRSFTVLAGHVHSRPRTRRPALLFLMTACQKTGADFHGPRQLLGSLRLAASATGEQWTLTGNLARLAGRSVRGRATNARVTRPPRRAPPPHRLAWQWHGRLAASLALSPAPTNHASGRGAAAASHVRVATGRPASADGVALGNARAPARAAAASPACWNKFLRPWPVIRSFV